MTYIGDQANYHYALALIDEAIEQARQIGEPWQIASALIGRGELTRVQGDDDVAQAVYEEGLELAVDSGDEELVSMCLGNLSFLAEHAGDHAEARHLGCEALRLSWCLGRRHTAAQAVSLLAGPELGLGRPERAAQLIGAADEAFRVLSAASHPGNRSERERVVAGLREALGDDAYRDLYAQGARLSLDEAVEIALGDDRVDEPPASPRTRRRL